MSDDDGIKALWDTIERCGRDQRQFQISRSQSNPPWVTVTGPNQTRTYPLGREAPVLLSAEFRHGIFD